MRHRVLILACALAFGAPADEYPAFAGGLAESVAGARTTVSGVSAGGYLAQQLHVAYSDRVSGVAAVAAGPWGCAEGNLMTAMARCMGAPDARPPVRELLGAARALAEDGGINALAALADDPVWLFRGRLDTTVSAAVAAAARAFYGELLPPERIRWIDTVAAAHHFPADGVGHDCAASESPFVGDCGFPAARALLEHLHPGRGAAHPPGATLERLAVPGAAAAGMADEAWVHVPETCRLGARCDVHVALHGCAQSVLQVGRAFIEQSGYREAGTAFAIVVLFPQVAPSAVNPYACWDWWGYTGSDYLTRDARQLSRIMALVERLRGREAEP